MKFDKDYYRSLTREELYDVLQNIDSEQYPERYQIVEDVFEEKGGVLTGQGMRDIDLDSCQTESGSIEVDYTKQPVEIDIKQFTTADISSNDDGILLLKKKLFLNLFWLLVFLVPIAPLIYFDASEEVSGFELIIFGLVGIAAIFGVFTQRREIKFDKNVGQFYLKGTDMIGDALVPHRFDMSQIAAIQLLSFQLKDHPQAFIHNSDEVGNLSHIYQLNLVLTNNKRINISQTTDGFEVISMSRKLARFLERPIWNNIDAHNKDIAFAKKYFG